VHHISLNDDCADMQVQETTLDWLVGLAAATALHLGPAILPLKIQINRVLKALFAAPSKVNSPPHGFPDQMKCCDYDRNLLRRQLRVALLIQKLV